MRNTLYLTLSFLLFNLTNLVAQSDESGIIKTVNDFLDGGTNGDVERFKNAFVPSAVQRSVGKNGVTGITVAELASKITPNQKMNRTTKIISWSYGGTAATAITETQYSSSKVVDFLNLLKVGNDWKIISRVFSRMELDENVVTSIGSVTTKSYNEPSKPAPAPKKKKAEPVDDGW